MVLRYWNARRVLHGLFAIGRAKTNASFGDNVDAAR